MKAHCKEFRRTIMILDKKYKITCMEKNLWRTGYGADIPHQEWDLGVITKNLEEKTPRTLWKNPKTSCSLETKTVCYIFFGREQRIKYSVWCTEPHENKLSFWYSHHWNGTIELEGTQRLDSGVIKTTKWLLFKQHPKSLMAEEVMGAKCLHGLKKL